MVRDQADYDLCIVGAGIAGLNALFVATRHLPSDARVALIDGRDRVGGMWVDTYDYVRLHQPYRLFTVGNTPWTLDQPREYLATKPEVVAHLQHCADVLAEQVELDQLLSWEVRDVEEHDDLVRVTCTSGDQQQTITADRLVVATGLDIQQNPPLSLSSGVVVSLSPDSTDVRHELGNDGAPVWIVGGGKTAMDTAHAIITHHRDRNVRLLAGSGTYFSERDRIFPGGARRWIAPRTGALFAKYAAMFDGTNEKELRRHHIERYGTSPVDDPKHFVFGVLSAAERDTIVGGLAEAVTDHLEDVVDGEDGPELVLRRGGRRPVAPGTVLVNCTGYLNPRGDPYEPYLSAGGRVLNLKRRMTLFAFPSIEAFLTTHLFLMDRLADAPLYALDVESLRRRGEEAMPWTLMALIQHNLSVVLDELSPKQLGEMGLDFDLWPPAIRRMPGQLWFAVTHRRKRPKYRETLDTVADRFDIRCGPLEYVSA